MKLYTLFLLLGPLPSLLARGAISSKLSDQTCQPGNNTVGACGCDGQLFLAEDCTQVDKFLVIHKITVYFVFLGILLPVRNLPRGLSVWGLPEAMCWWWGALSGPQTCVSMSNYVAILVRAEYVHMKVVHALANSSQIYVSSFIYWLSI